MRFSTLFIFLFSCVMMPSISNASDKSFFKTVQGKWSGPGEIVAGKYKGTKFVCTFGGMKTKHKTGMEIDGSCRVGVFAQPMNALIIRASGGYAGKFLDGEKGKGMDITGGQYAKGRLIANIKRKDLDGKMVANLTDPNALKVTISVHHEGKLVPVIGMNLARTSDPVVTGLID